VWSSIKTLPQVGIPLSLLTLTVGTFIMARTPVQAAETKVPLVFSEGHATDPKDGGRPVVLIAAALEVKPEAFREAFRSVRPARNGRPSREEAQRNKAALMKVLKPLGVTNDRLDEVSDYYRYQPQRGDLWKHAPAKGHAVVENGKITKIVVTDAGAGYSSAPAVTIQGMDTVRLKATVKFDKDLKKNGSILSVEIQRITDLGGGAG
jgi:hypothetical protein